MLELTELTNDQFFSMKIRRRAYLRGIEMKRKSYDWVSLILSHHMCSRGYAKKASASGGGNASGVKKRVRRSSTRLFACRNDRFRSAFEQVGGCVGGIAASNRS